MVTRTTLLAIIAGITLFLDQIIKVIIRNTLLFGERVGFIPGIMDLTRVHNTGVAFGLFSNAQVLMSVLAIGIIVFLIVKREEFMVDMVSTVALGLVLGGAIGNLLDRVFFGYVLDYLDLGWWPAFNIADIGVVVGGLLLLVVHLRLSLNNSRRTNQ